MIGGISVHDKVFEYENHYAMKKNRIKVLENSRFTCQYCGGTATEVHHKDRSKNNHAPDNLIPVCHKCHMQIHADKNSAPRWDTEMILVAMMQHGLNKGELAARAGITRQTITRLLKTGLTKNSTMKRIANILGYPIEAFLLPKEAFKLSQLEKRAATINDIKLAIECKLEAVQDPVLHRRYHIWIANDIKRRFGVRSYFDVPKERIDEAIEFIKQWAIPGTNNQEAATSEAVNQ
jgi:transcriptional regulator with XRE-family HTH domain